MTSVPLSDTHIVMLVRMSNSSVSYEIPSSSLSEWAAVGQSVEQLAALPLGWA